MAREFKNVIYSLRKSQHLSQSDLADQLGVSRSAVSFWECGGRTPNRKTLLKIADLFGVDMDYLLRNTSTVAATEDAAELTLEEKTLLSRYNNLDDRGKNIVMTLIESEMQYSGTGQDIETLNGTIAISGKGDDKLSELRPEAQRNSSSDSTEAKEAEG